MPNWLSKLFSTSMPASGPDIALDFTFTLTPWQWFAAALACALAGWWSYRTLLGSPTLRLICANCRALTLLLLVFILTGPKLIQTKTNIERDWVLTLIDRSASLNIADSPNPTTLPTRNDQLRDALTQANPAFEAIAASRTLAILGFDQGLYTLSSPSPASSSSPANIIASLPPPTGLATDIPQALDRALDRALARPVSGIVLFSDGQSTTGLIPKPLIRKLSDAQIPLFIYPLGTPNLLSDTLIDQADAPPSSFQGDLVPVRITLKRTSAEPRTDTINLIDQTSTQTPPAILDTQPVTWAANQTSQSLTLTAVPSPTQAPTQAPAPQANWLVTIVPSSTDLVVENNSRSLSVSITREPLRVLYLDGYPRWEYRFLKNLLTREQTLAFSSALLAPGRQFLTEGQDTLLTLPTTEQDWNNYDILMLGDINPSVLTPDQLTTIKSRVAAGKLSLLWIAGQGHVPQSFAGTPLEDLLPIRISQNARITSFSTDVTLAPTPLAEQLGILRLAQRQPDGSFFPTFISDPNSGWSRLRWAQRLDANILKPAAEPLAFATPVPPSTETPSPIILTMRFGSGRIVYFATDEIWRYRFGRGEDLPERIYIQILRLLGKDATARAGKPALLTLQSATPAAQPQVSTPVRVTLELLDQQLLSTPPNALAVTIKSTSQPTLTLELTPTPTTSSSSGRSYSTTWIPSEPATYTATPTDPSLASVFASIDVVAQDLERQNPSADHSLLAELALQTSGKILTDTDLKNLNDLLPRRESRTIAIARQETLWDKWIVWLTLITTLLTEWLLRRKLRLS